MGRGKSCHIQKCESRSRSANDTFSQKLPLDVSLCKICVKFHLKELKKMNAIG